MSTPNLRLGFASGATKGQRVLLIGVEGREAISHLFQFDLLLRTPDGPLSPETLDDLLVERAAITMGPEEGDVVHGIISQVEALDVKGTLYYRARLVPNVALLTMGLDCAIYQETTVPDMVRKVLKDYQLAEGEHFDVLVALPKKSPTREYICQYQESDWDFIQRWLEHEGYFYWFEHGKSGEKLIIADENSDTSKLIDATLAYNARAGMVENTSTVSQWRLTQRRIPQKVSLIDYNYRTPTQILTAQVDVYKNGFGNSIHYGEHFKDKDLGKELAKLRAQRHLTERQTFAGSSNCPRVRVGHRFELENHYDANMDGTYLITAIRHRVGIDPLLRDARPQAYTAHFEAIPFDTQFRPERKTAWPRITGLMHAHIDSDTSGDYARIDEQGRYKVKMPYDTQNNNGVNSSRWIRMSQPYAGAGYGMHTPLHKGTEVVIAHIDGDPDRPLIIGAVPNPATASPSVAANHTQSVIQTASGIRVEMEDLQT